MTKNEAPNLSENAQTVLKNRYYLRDNGDIVEDWKQLCERVATNISQKETDPQWKDKFFDVLYNRDFLANSPCLMNAGGELQMLSACFVLGIDDSTTGIADANKNAMLIWKAGGGTGFDFSTLRQEGARVGKSSGIASGPCSFIRIFNTAAEEMKQGGRRRGANMGILRIDHPDILKFIFLKKDLREKGFGLSFFNLSVGVTDEFLTALSKGTKYNLKDPRTNEAVGSLSSRYVWNKIAEGAWTEGCPGVVFIDRVNKHNTCKHLDPIKATNPCITGDTLVAVADGRDAVSFKQLASEGKDVLVYCKDNNGITTVKTMRNPRVTGYNEKVYKVTLDDGSSIKCTKNHKFLLKNGTYKEASELVTGTSLAITTKQKATALGKLVANGQENTGTQKHWALSDGANSRTNSTETFVKQKRDLPKAVLNSSVCVNKKCEHCKNEFLVEFCKREQAYCSTECGFLAKLANDKQEPCLKLEAAYNHKVVSVEFVGVDTVYNGTVDEFHNFGIVLNEKTTKNNKRKLEFIYTLNCGEQPLRDGESCNLGSINLTRFVKENGEWDFDRLEKVVHTAIRALDNMIDVNKFPLEKIKEETEKTRKIGLGIMGFADCLAMKMIAYDSVAGLAEAEKIMEFINNKSHEASSQLAQEKGNFPAYKGSEWDQKNIPMRNASCTTIAPTGTISTIADCWFGIEPYNGLVMRREVFPEGTGKTAKKQTLWVVNDLFVNAVKDLKIQKKVLKKVQETGSCQSLRPIPTKIRRVFKIAHEILPIWHLKMQEAFQKHCDSAVSKTINLPNTATVKHIRDIFTKAAKGGVIKGVTVFRDGSLPEQVIYLGTGGDKVNLKRGDIIPVADESKSWKKKVESGCGHMTVFINYSDERGIQDFYVAQGGKGGCPSIQGVSRMCSLAWRGGIALDAIVDQCSSVKCPASIKNTKDYKSCSDIIGKVILEFCSKFPEVCKVSNKFTKKADSEQPVKLLPKMETKNEIHCPECDTPLDLAEGCKTCRLCGFSVCS